MHGFGACMIAGVPHPFEESFFWKFAAGLRQSTGLEIESRVVSLGGFPTYKAAAHVKRALVNNPDYVVIQLGSTDLTVSLNRHLRSLWSKNLRNGGDASSSTGASIDAMGPFERSKTRAIIEFAKDCLCRMLFVSPIHGGASIYLSAIRQVLAEISRAGAKPILLAPFPHGDRVSNHWARRFTSQLAELAKSENVIFVDSFNGLIDIPLSDLLYSDRLHLTRIGHERVSALLVDALSSRLAIGSTIRIVPQISTRVGEMTHIPR